jgi:disulfide bond formation protein DsbB
VGAAASAPLALRGGWRGLEARRWYNAADKRRTTLSYSWGRAMARAAREARVAPVDIDEQRVDVVTAATRHVALLAAMIATCGSLYFSEVLGWLPCELCWFQRILMYPLTVILAVGILRDDRAVHLYGLPLSLTGMAVALFHYLEVLKVIPPSPCSGGVPCSIDYINMTGALSFVKIPFLALVAFTIISVMLGNYAIAGAPGTPAARRRASAIAAIAIVVVTIVVFVALGFAI